MEAFMGGRCPFSCDVCGRSGNLRAKRGVAAARSACEDVDPECEAMAIDGLCFDPEHQSYLEKACPFACDVCSDRKRRRARAIADLKRSFAKRGEEEEEEEEEKRGCQDHSSKCEQYAVDGLCHDADISMLMLKTCPFACDRCKREVKARSACEDVDPTCEEKAIDGLCFDPEYQAYMEKSCPFACDVCSGRKKRRARAIAELRVDVAAIDAAAAAKRSEETTRFCGDFSPRCESFATDGFCSDPETSALMKKTCPFACDGCKRDVKEEAVVEGEKKEALVEEAQKKEEVKMEAAKKEAEKEDVAEEEAMRVAKEVAKKEVKAAMMEAEILWARSFAGLLADAADADSAGAEKRGCADFSSKCNEYAAIGLCGEVQTSSLMMKTCPSSCGSCGKRELDSKAEMAARAACRDSKTKCERWALHGMCKSDPDMEHFMAKTCPFACDLC